MTQQDKTEQIEVIDEIKPMKKPKKHLNPLIYWGIFVVSAIVFTVIFYLMPMFPNKWAIFAGIVLLAIAIGMFLLTKEWKKGRVVTKVINALLAILLIIGSVLLPNYKAKVSDVITTQPQKTVIRMNLYTMSDKYRKAHEDVFTNEAHPEEKDDLKDLQQYKEDMLITSLLVDNKNQRDAITEYKNLIEKQDISVKDYESVQEAVDALYNNVGSLLLMNETYEGIFTNDEKYENFKNDTRVVYTIELTDDMVIETADADITKEPFSVFFGGNDDEGDLSLVGRTDVDMVVTVNPITHQISIVSFPRDSYIPNPALGNRPDKLTHLGMQGLQNTLNGLGNLLDTNIDNYVLINFTTYQKIIDALGGVTVNNPYAFGFWDRDPSDVWFEEGEITLDGYDALLYVRERKTLPDGDFGRTMHQQIVMRAIIEKLTSSAIITRFDAILTNMKGTFLTNISDTSIYALCQKQLDENIQWNIVNYRVLGGTGMAACASSGTRGLSVVLPYANQVDFVANVIHQIINGEVVEQQEMPAGAGYVCGIVAPDPDNIEVTDDPIYEDQGGGEATPTPGPDEPIPTPDVPPDPTPDVPTPPPDPTPDPTPDPGDGGDNSGG